MGDFFSILVLSSNKSEEHFNRAGGKSENPGDSSSNVVGVICPIVGIGLTDLPKWEGASTPSASVGPA